MMENIFKKIRNGEPLTMEEQAYLAEMRGGQMQRMGSPEIRSAGTPGIAPEAPTDYSPEDLEALFGMGSLEDRAQVPMRDMAIAEQLRGLATGGNPRASFSTSTGASGQVGAGGAGIAQAALAGLGSGYMERRGRKGLEGIRNKQDELRKLYGKREMGVGPGVAEGVRPPSLVDPRRGEGSLWDRIRGYGARMR